MSKLKSCCEGRLIIHIWTESEWQDRQRDVTTVRR